MAISLTHETSTPLEKIYIWKYTIRTPYYETMILSFEKKRFITERMNIVKTQHYKASLFLIY